MLNTSEHVQNGGRGRFLFLINHHPIPHEHREGEGGEYGSAYPCEDVLHAGIDEERDR